MVSFDWDGYTQDTEDDTSVSNLLAEFRTYLKEERNRKFYNNFMDTVDILEDTENPEDEKIFVNWVKTKIVDVVLEEPLENWLKDSDGWKKFVERPRLKTGKLETTKIRRTEGDKRRKDKVVVGGGQTIIPNKKNIEYISDKKLKDILNTAVTRRLSGLQFLRETEEKPPELSDDDIEEYFLGNPIAKEQMIFKEMVNPKTGIPTGKMTYGTANNTDKDLKAYTCHMLLEWPSLGESDLEKAVTNLAADRREELSAELGETLETTKSYKKDNIETLDFSFDFSLPQDFINEFGDKQFLTTKLYMLEEEGRFAGEAAGQVNIGEKEALRRVIEQYKEYKKEYAKAAKEAEKQGKSISQINSKLQVEGDEDKMLTLGQYKEKNMIVPRTLAAPLTAEIQEIWAENAQDGKATIPMMYSQDKWQESKYPVTWEIRGSVNDPIKIELNVDSLWDTLENAITQEIEKAAKTWSQLRPKNEVKGIRAAATVTTASGKTKKLTQMVADEYGKEIEGKDFEEFNIGVWYALQDKKGKKIEKPQEDGKYISHKEDDKEKYEQVVISQKQYNELSPEEREKFWTIKYVKFDFTEHMEDLRQFEQDNKILLVNEEGFADIYESGVMKFRTGQLDVSDPNDKLSKATIKVECSLVTYFVIPYSKQTQTGNKELMDDIDTLKYKIRTLMQELD
tara:strand:+ start:4500 stop:6539 length:2040 start_codon:yes stop_codon:yes gene_type:complete